MKRFIITIALTIFTLGAFAQNNMLAQRMEIVQLETEDLNTVELEVFYMNDESPRVYYLSLGHLGIGTDILQLTFDPVYELFIPLGGTLEEAVAKMEEIKDFYKLPRQAEKEITGCFAAIRPNGELIPVKVTSRKLLSAKILEFSLPTGSEGLVRATHIQKSEFGSLLTSLKVYRKLHPKEQ